MPSSLSARAVWVMRKPRSLGNFSIETSYKTMLGAWPEDAPTPDVHVASRYTSGLVDRWHIWKEVRQLKAALIHITGDVHFTAIRLHRKPVVLTIHDLGMLDEGGPVKRWLKKCFWLDLPLQSCDHLIAVSEETKRDIMRRTSYPGERIHVIPSVISPSFHARTATPSAGKARALHIGLADNKNLEGHAKALANLHAHLRIIGMPSDAQINMLEGLGIEYSCASKLTEAQLQEEYAAADVLLFCSTLEGYGMPIIEAQTVGVPVITSARAPMNETAGAGAILVNPDQPLDIQNAIERVLTDSNMRDTLIAKGKENAEACSAEMSAQRHADLYAQMLHQEG